MSFIWTAIVTIIGGVIIGSLGKFFAPGGRDKLPFWLTVVVGIVGMILGNVIYYQIFGLSHGAEAYNAAHPSHPKYGWDNTTQGIDWWRHIWQIAIAAILVVILSSFTAIGRKRS